MGVTFSVGLALMAAALISAGTVVIVYFVVTVQRQGRHSTVFASRTGGAALRSWHLLAPRGRCAHAVRCK
jgi:hypothetical protein